MRPLAACIIAPALLILASATKAPAESSDTCTAARATAASIEAVQADFENWVGRCVRLRGIVLQGRLYANRDAILESRIEAKPTRSIAIYDERGKSRPPQPGTSVEISGRLGSCAKSHAQANAEARANPQLYIIVLGYCHSSSENYVRPASWRTTGGPRATRFTEAELAPAQRRLLDAPSDIPGRAEHLREARDLATALANRDEAEFRRLTRPGLPAETAAYGGRRLPALLQDEVAEARRDFRRTRRSNFDGLLPLAKRQERIFIDRTGLEDITEYIYLTTCWCRTARCAGRWPTMPEEADNLPDRPYVCVRTAGGVVPPGQDAAITAEAGPLRPSLPEPKWPRR